MRLPYIVITCARIDSIKRGEPPFCPGVFSDLSSIHDNFGDKDGILKDILRRESEDIPKQDPSFKMPNESDAAPNPVRNIGKVQKFAVGADFEAYAEQLEFFFLANGVTDSNQKKAVLLAKDLDGPDIVKRRFSHVRHDRRASPKAIEAPEICLSRQV